MSHLLVIELPGGEDGDILVAAREEGHRVSLLTADPAHYRRQPALAALLEGCEQVIDAGDFAQAAPLPRLLALHAASRFDAVLCLQDLRIIEAARIARALGLAHLNPATAALCRDKAAVRARLAAAGIAQPPARRVRGPRGLIAAAEALGPPLVIKPIDGFGSQNIFALRDAADLALLRARPEIIAGAPGGYGLGVAARGALLVERMLTGELVGCDTFTAAGRHHLLGVNHKQMFTPPSFAIRSGCFCPNTGQYAAIEAHVCALLDAIGFNHGAAHIELMLTDAGPVLIEINPRLVGARLPRLISAARRRSIHSDLIALHLEGALPRPAVAPRCAATRWLAAPRAG
ncbi:MAG: ATP-grasp domain-containing protein, partial [Sphingomonadales bacterium]|nr:ATP-grasp domain-containing protein [Sphingomonadales bacterium]